MSITHVATRIAQPVVRAQAAAQSVQREGTALARTSRPHVFSCRCGSPVFFGNSACTACNTPLGYDCDALTVVALEPAGDDRLSPLVAPAPAPVSRADATSTSWWRAASSSGVHAAARTHAPRFRRCANLDTPAACNWLVAESDSASVSSAGTSVGTSGDGAASSLRLCRCCRLARTLPDLTASDGACDVAVWWNRIEVARRRLVASLIGLDLPLRSHREDPDHGLAFDLLQAPLGAPPLATGHAGGVITLDLEEADDAWRRQRRMAMDQPCRTVLGQLRHDSGHYFWHRLVANGPWLKRVRAVFGDERQDHASALRLHARSGAPADWRTGFVSGFASSHPTEDWAETWAFYLKLVDTLNVASSLGMDGEGVEIAGNRLGATVVSEADGPEGAEFLQLINGWSTLSAALDALSRSMGVPEVDSFELSALALRKLYFVHRVISDARSQ